MKHQSDANERAIVKALRDAGATVTLIRGTVAKGVPDLLVGFRGETVLLEVKLPLGPKGGRSHSELSVEQVDFIANWQGGPVCVVRSVEEALQAVGLLPERTA